MNERGTVTLLALGLWLSLLFLGGISLDLWRAFSELRALAAAADAAAEAGANAIDVARYRLSGRAVLDPARAEALARESLKEQADRRSLVEADVDATQSLVTVVARGTVRMTLLRVFLANQDPFTLTVTASAEPRLGAR